MTADETAPLGEPLFEARQLAPSVPRIDRAVLAWGRWYTSDLSRRRGDQQGRHVRRLSPTRPARSGDAREDRVLAAGREASMMNG
ncbi:hypothetical protein [Agromyces ramosus]|uniref:hypothetical protein n=1 Tax=Agromyces ramosus TaxID=33879 RepID=UPI0027D7D537|nr:hypothetical protein [Agromyces ramosus]